MTNNDLKPSEHAYIPEPCYSSEVKLEPEAVRLWEEKKATEIQYAGNGLLVCRKCGKSKAGRWMQKQKDGLQYTGLCLVCADELPMPKSALSKTAPKPKDNRPPEVKERHQKAVDLISGSPKTAPEVKPSGYVMPQLFPEATLEVPAKDIQRLGPAKKKTLPATVLKFYPYLELFNVFGVRRAFGLEDVCNIVNFGPDECTKFMEDLIHAKLATMEVVQNGRKSFTEYRLLEFMG